MFFLWLITFSLLNLLHSVLGEQMFWELEAVLYTG